MVLLVIDGNSIVNRAFYGIRALSNKNGVFTNAVFGFMNIYLKTLGEVKPDAIAVAFDLPSPTFRHKAVSSYKATRHGMPDELAMQLPYLKKLLRALGVKIVECEGFEADDILGTLSRLCAKSGNSCVLLSGDRDNLQLINESTTMRLATNSDTMLYDTAVFQEEYGFAPPLLVDLKALMGDSSDNIKGVAGIGKKTAGTLVSQLGTIESIYASLDSPIITAKMREKLKAGADDAKESKWLATICTDAPIGVEPCDCLPSGIDREAASSLLRELELQKLLERLELDSVKPAESAAAEPVECPTITLLPENSISELDLNKPVAVLAENGALALFQDGKVLRLTTAEARCSFFEKAKELLTFGAKPVYRIAFKENAATPKISVDGEICAYLLESGTSQYNISTLCEGRTNYFTELGENADIAAIPELCGKLFDEIQEKGMLPLLRDIEQPLTEVLASMEHIGIAVDSDGVRSFGDGLKLRISELTEQVYELAGKSFNIASTKQLGEILFETLGLPFGKKTKTGYSTNADVLEKLADKHPIVPLVLEYRKLTKLNSTYVDGLLKTVADDGRIHTSFRQTETRTGRISSTEPNLQNIPIRTELGRNMRRFFKAADGMTIVDADYSQIELRLLAHISGDKSLREAFLSGRDIHTSTAAQVFGVPEALVTSAMRTAAKAVNFGIMYGIGAFSLSQDIGVSVARADKYIKDYLGSYPKVSEFMERTIADAIRDGYVTTMLGRRRYIPELSASNKNIQAFGKRAAMNAPIQGTAADIIKIAMIRVYQRLKNEKLSARLVMQVHDELLVEAPDSEAEYVSSLVSEEMRAAAELSVPLVAETGVGKTWFEAKH